MKNKYILAILLIVLALVVGFVLFIKDKEKKDSGFVYLEGTVTAYDVTPTYTDGGIIFKIDDTSVDIGGGLRAGPPKGIGSVYSPIHIGDKVEAKLISSEQGYLTVYNCPDCYVRKQ